MLVVNKAPRSVLSESYNSLRTRLIYASVDNPIKTIVITSSLASEGKTTVACNLALSLSNLEKRVLLVDCNLRTPSIKETLSIPSEIGLTDMLINDYGLSKVVYEFNSNFHIITSGTLPSNPSDIIGSQKLKNLIKNLKNMYDYIILDTPSILEATDAQLLAAYAQGTVLVVKANETRSKFIGKAYKELQSVQANLIGTVLVGREIKCNKPRNIKDNKIFYKKRNKNGH